MGENYVCHPWSKDRIKIEFAYFINYILWLGSTEFFHLCIVTFSVLPLHEPPMLFLDPSICYRKCKKDTFQIFWAEKLRQSLVSKKIMFHPEQNLPWHAYDIFLKEVANIS